MKKVFAKKMSVIAGVLTLLVAFMTLNHSLASADSWGFVDGNGADGINADPARAASNPKLVDFNGTLYAAWSESIGSTSQIRLKKYDDSTGAWTTADNNAPINKDASKDALNPSLVVFNNELYAAWQELSTAASYWQLRVKKLSGSTWISVDGDGAYGLNATANSNARNANLVVYKNDLYAIWDETGGNGINQLRVKKYSGSGSSWSPADGGAGLNKNTGRAAQFANSKVWKDKLYVSWQELDGSYTNQIRIKAYDGSNWSFVDGGGDNGLNVDISRAATTANMEVYGENGGELYVAWNESTSAKTQIRVKKYDGSGWTFVDGGDAAKGINHNIAADGYRVSLAAFDGDLYATWQEGMINKVRVKKYDGVDWVSVDGNGTNGLNKAAGSAGIYGYLAVHTTPLDTGLYAIFLENNGVNQVRVVRMGPSNAAPTATGVSFTGTLNEGNTLTGTYTYGDAENDAEGATALKWYTADNAAGANKTVIAGASTSTLALTNAQANKFIIFEVTPAAATGTSSGAAASYTSASAVAANAAPTATGVSFTGTLKEGHTLTGSYTYGDAENDAEGATTLKWYTADDAAGANKTVIAGASASSFTLTHAQVGKYIVFEVTPVASAGGTPGTPVTYTSAAAVAANEAPTVSGVQITGEFKLNQLLTGTYTYSDVEGDAEGLTEFKWYTADNAAGANKTEIPGASGKTLVLKAPQFNKFVLFEATPVALSGTLAGAPVGSAWAGPAGVLYGDANGDGLVTPADALIVNKFVSGKIELTDEQKTALDMDNDGSVDADDAKIILNIYNGIGA